MKSKSIIETKRIIEQKPEDWLIPFMEFVDDFRRTKDINMIQKAFELTDPKIDSILASTIEYLCHEMHLETPNWVWDIPVCREPWFVSGIESLKAVTICESPVYFRRRNIFVLENFLDRV
jgi:hypothetical protein